MSNTGVASSAVGAPDDRAKLLPERRFPTSAPEPLRDSTIASATRCTCRRERSARNNPQRTELVFDTEGCHIDRVGKKADAMMDMDLVREPGLVEADRSRASPPVEVS